MDRAAFTIKNQKRASGLFLKYGAYFVFVLLAPFVGSPLLLFLLTFVFFLGLKFSKKSFSKSQDLTKLAFSMSVLLFISLLFEGLAYSLPLYIVLGAFAISVSGEQVSYFRESQRQENEKGFSGLRSSAFLGLRILAAFLAGSWALYWQELSVSSNLVFFIAVIGAVTGALFESIPSGINRNISVPLGAGMTMWIFEEFRYSVPPQEMLLALGFSLLLGFLAYRAKIADISALLSAALLGLLIIVFSGLSWYLLLLTFFILGGGFTRYKYRYKESIGLAQEKGGIRSYENVFSNSTTALVLAIAYGVFPAQGQAILYAYLGTVATATGDTLASEIGTTAKGSPRLITNLKVASPGEDGAISWLGELAALFGSLLIGLLAYALGVTDNFTLSVLLATAGGFLGTNVDSLLGATFQKKGLLSNSGVNFVATFAGAGISGGLYLLSEGFLWFA